MQCYPGLNSCPQNAGSKPVTKNENPTLQVKLQGGVYLTLTYIPDVLLKAGLLFWLACFIFTDYIPLTQALFGAAVGFGTMYLIYYGSRGRMGLGDVTFAGLIGLYLGPSLTGLTLIIAFILSALVGVFLLATQLKQRKDALPFGPFLAIGAYVAMLL